MYLTNSVPEANNLKMLLLIVVVFDFIKSFPRTFFPKHPPKLINDSSIQISQLVSNANEIFMTFEITTLLTPQHSLTHTKSRDRVLEIVFEGTKVKFIDTSIIENRRKKL